MLPPTQNETQLIYTAKELLHILIRREGSIEKINEFIEPDISGFGILKENIVRNLDDYLKLFNSISQQFPNIDFELLHQSSRIIGDTGVVEGELNFLLTTHNGEIHKLYTRFSFVFVNTEDGWKGVSMHLSAPLSEFDNNGIFTIDALKAKNEELQLLVNNRTMQLQQKLKELEEVTYTLKAMQVQLVEQEKLASLGELTAGIAHEIQNPLNFVNNFSEVSVELASELCAEIESASISTEEKSKLKSIVEDLVHNQQKITFHGKRAGSIVKGMLQHSRKSTGEKEPTDINALVDEYLRLSYYGLRAKDKTFNVALRTNFDDRIEKINVVPQDLGRVLLNLFTNAFYSVMNKKKKINGLYEPVVTVTTRKESDGIKICVWDNGLGIAQQDINKIYQPFFTTKPTGEGTGLGLSMSYDIISKEHGGKLTVNTEEGEYAEFIILLPA